jgi:uncharacterized protein
LGISTIADQIARKIDETASTVTSPFRDPVIRLGVTGLSRAGKTVFITALVANLLDRGRMGQFTAAISGTITGAILQPQPDDTLPRFAYETHLARLTGPTPSWPESTSQISALRISLRVQPNGILAGLTGARRIHLDIVDYPGEWLLDLGLLDQSFAQWSQAAITRAQNRPEGAAFLALLDQIDAHAPLAEPQAIALADGFSAHLLAARAAGFSDCTPGRFLLPGDLAGSPVLTFAPLRSDPQARATFPKGSLGREFQRRYDAYKQRVVRPFFRDHFAKIDRQIVLVDVLGAVHAGPAALDDLRGAMAGVLAVFKTGRNAFLKRIWQGRRVEKILFAATKADHLHHSQHAQLTAITQALLRDAKDRADFTGASTAAMSIAALRATVEDQITHQGSTLDVVRGRLLDSGKPAAFYPGALPDDPAHLLAPARAGAQKWLDADYQVMNFAPAPLHLQQGDGPPHIRLDKAAAFLLGDKL